MRDKETLQMNHYLRSLSNRTKNRIDGSDTSPKMLEKLGYTKYDEEVTIKNNVTTSHNETFTKPWRGEYGKDETVTFNLLKQTVYSSNMGSDWGGSLNIPLMRAILCRTTELGWHIQYPEDEDM